MTSLAQKAVVVGAGLGGLACAIDLAAAGFEVTVHEKSAASGGKARAVKVGDVEMDAGPTVLTMPWVFDELWENAGATFRSDLPLERAEILARHAWSDGQRLDLFADRRASADAIGAAFGPGEGRAYLAFCEDAKRIYDIAEKPFIRGQRMTMGSIVKEFGARGLTALAKLDSHRSMAKAIEGHFRSPRLRQLFGRYATYCGSSPYEAPGTLNLVSHVEAEGVYRTPGGMSGLARAMEGLARRLGVTFVYESNVERIVVERGRASGIQVRSGFVDADVVVFNGDVSALGAALLGAPAAKAADTTPRSLRSLSAVTWSMVGRATGFPLVHHNVFFSDRYEAEFDALLARDGARVPDEPTIYVCAHDRGDRGADAPRERFLVLANAPADGDAPARWDEREKERCSRAMQKQLAKTGLSIEPDATVVTTPADFERLFPATGGALYGPRSKGATSVLAREGASTRISGLYLAGGSVHPGPGVPMSALSGRLAAARICTDLGSTGRSRRAATTGTTSTA